MGSACAKDKAKPAVRAQGNEVVIVISRQTRQVKPIIKPGVFKSERAKNVRFNFEEQGPFVKPVDSNAEKTEETGLNSSHLKILVRRPTAFNMDTYDSSGAANDERSVANKAFLPQIGSERSLVIDTNTGGGEKKQLLGSPPPAGFGSPMPGLRRQGTGFVRSEDADGDEADNEAEGGGNE